VERHGGGGEEWTKGKEYVRLWQEGVRPTYSTALAEPVLPQAPSAEEIAKSVDYMQVAR